MAERIPVTILGATGAVGQRFVTLLAEHPWFQIAGLAASERSAGQRYAEACKWVLDAPMPASVSDLRVCPTGWDLPGRLVFSALPGGLAGPVEEELADAGYVVCSNASAHRMDPDVPLVVPEVNAGHLELIAAQRRRRGAGKGYIVTNPNCSTTMLVLALAPLAQSFGIRKLHVVTLQALSGAGYPGVPSLDIIDNVVPHISGEEEKMQTEPLKLLGRLDGERIAPAALSVSAQCNRVPVLEGHLLCVSVELEKPATPEHAMAAWREFRGLPVGEILPTLPAQPLCVSEEFDRPQPRRDRNAGGGMTVTIGKARPCDVLGLRFVALGHNTVRGAAGGSLAVAELLASRGML